MEWDVREILKAVGNWGVPAAVAVFIAKKMDWIRFGKSDEAKVEKVRAEVALDLAAAAEKEIEKEVKLSKAALQWTVNISGRLEKALMMIEKLYGVIDKMKEDFNNDMEKLKLSYEKRIEDLKAEFERSKEEFIAEGEENRKEIKRLKALIDGNN